MIVLMKKCFYLKCINIVHDYFGVILKLLCLVHEFNSLSFLLLVKLPFVYSLKDNDKFNIIRLGRSMKKKREANYRTPYVRSDYRPCV